MAYDATTGMITAPVSIQDISRCFKVRMKKRIDGSWIYRTSADLGMITNENPPILSDGWAVDSREDINIWSKYKPVDNTEIQYMDQWDAAHNTWKNDATWFHGRGFLSLGWRYGFKPYGTTVQTGSALKTWLQAAYAIQGGLNGWECHLPSGSNYSNPYRLTDYAGYNHKAKGFGDSFLVASPITINSQTSKGTISAAFAYAPDDGTNVTPENIFGVTPSGKKVYYGVLLTYTENGTTYNYYGTALNPDEVTIQEDVNLPTGKTFRAYPFIALLNSAHPFSKADEPMEVYSIPLLSYATVRTASSSQTINLDIDGEYLWQDYTTAKIKITTYSVSYSNCWIELTSGSTTFVVTLGAWSGRNVSGTIGTSGSSTKFDLSALGSGDYVITLTNLNPNMRYQGKLYVNNSISDFKGFGIMEQIDPNA